MFIGREKELNELEKMYKEDNFQMPVIYGRRRIGKSTLIQEFAKNKKAILFTAIESSAQRNLDLLSQNIYRVLAPELPSLPAFSSFEAAFDFLGESAQKERLVVVIDEYPYLASADKSISSILQLYIDQKFKNSKMYLILCGSSMSFMENQVLGYQSPLYGRRTAQFKIQPFDYKTSSRFVPNYSAEDKALVYGVTGGVPKYLELFMPDLSVHENIVRLFFTDSGYLYEEPGNLLKQELREAGTYNTIIEAIASGANRINEISTKTHLDTPTVSYYLKTLISLEIVEKETAITDENNRKKVSYIISDQMFRFWYRFVPAGTSMIVSKDGENYYAQAVKPMLSDYMGKVFENMCKRYMMELSKQKKLPFTILNVGRWWGSNPTEKREEEIDLIGINNIEKRMILGECKYRKDKLSIDILEKLEEKSNLLPKHWQKNFILFSKNGFTDTVRKYAENSEIKLATLEEMYLDD